MIHKIFDDPSGGVINLRYLKRMLDSLSYLNIDENEQKELLSLFLLVSVKLSSVWNHKSNYERIENDLIGRAKSKPLIAGRIDNQIDLSQELFDEFDEYLVQVKSCIDHLVKVLAIIYGKRIWTLRSFSGKGNDVIKALKNNTPAKLKTFAPSLQKLIEDHQIWLTEIISARDRINHFIDGGINFESFVVTYQRSDKVERLIVPKWSDSQSISELMEVVWMNLIRFAEDFSMLSIGMRVKREYVFIKTPLLKGTNPTRSPWRVENIELEKIKRELINLK